MKKLFLFVLSCFVINATYSQDIVKENYTVSGGLLGAANFSEFRNVKASPSNIDYMTKVGWAPGVWLNLPVGEHFSVEPQLLYSSQRYQTNNTSSNLLLKDGSIRYLSIPLLLKFHAGDKIAIVAGPQVDFVTGVKDENNTAQESDFKQSSFSAFAGLEICPRGRVTVFGRYIYGFSNMDDRPGHTATSEYKNQNIQAGLKLKLFGKKGSPTYRASDVAETPVVIMDTDGDGINDSLDKCPSQAGIAKYDGCPIPDSDNDGINDEEDKCPNQAGIAKYNGCPIPDSDGDGINDEEDKCPNQAGPADRNGCPVTDRDNDGINDEQDKCPDIAGVASNNGCPEVPANVSKTLSASAQHISFGTTNAKLTSKSAASLDQVVTIMNDNPGLKVKIEAHTDNAGNDDTNMKLSEDRAAAVKAYLVSKGISEDRITSEGFGETMPVADNNTAAGRIKNRRVEIKVSY